MNSPTRNEIVEKLRQYMEKNFPLFSLQDVSMSDDLIEKGIIDSLGYLEIINYVEDKFDITVKDSEVTPENFQSIDTIASYIQNRLSRAESEVPDPKA